MSNEMDEATEAAWAYERLHVDALFRQWAAQVLDAASVGSGQRVLDVACGTGAVARIARDRVGPTGSVAGVDLDPGMLAVAEHIQPDIDWRQGDAGALPFDDDGFDAVVSQFGLMFFPDRVGAIREMLRCARPGARVVVAVWDSLEHSDAFATSVDLLERRAGAAAADALRAPFQLGDTAQLRALFEQAGASTVSIDTRAGTARFPSVRSMVEADLRGWLPLLGIVLDDELIESILHEADDVLTAHVNDGDTMVFDVRAHLVTALA